MRRIGILASRLVERRCAPFDPTSRCGCMTVSGPAPIVRSQRAA